MASKYSMIFFQAISTVTIRLSSLERISQIVARVDLNRLKSSSCCYHNVHVHCIPLFLGLEHSFALVLLFLVDPIVWRIFMFGPCLEMQYAVLFLVLVLQSSRLGWVYSISFL